MKYINEKVVNYLNYNYSNIKLQYCEKTMTTQSEAALESGLIKALQNMSYEYVKIEEETNLKENFKTQLEKHNSKELARIGRVHFTDEECDTRWYPQKDYHTMYISEVLKVLVKEEK